MIFFSQIIIYMFLIVKKSHLLCYSGKKKLSGKMYLPGDVLLHQDFSLSVVKCFSLGALSIVVLVGKNFNDFVEKLYSILSYSSLFFLSLNTNKTRHDNIVFSPHRGTLNFSLHWNIYFHLYTFNKDFFIKKKQYSVVSFKGSNEVERSPPLRRTYRWFLSRIKLLKELLKILKIILPWWSLREPWKASKWSNA